MGSSSTPTAQPVSTKKKQTQAKVPDYHLFNALQATRMALGDLDKMASSTAEAIDPRKELKEIEAQIMGGKDKIAAGKVVGGVGTGKAGQLGTPSLRVQSGSGGSPVPSTTMGGQGRAMSVATSGIGQSPAIR